MDTCKCPDRNDDYTPFGDICPACGKFRAEDIEFAPGDFVVHDQDDGSRPVWPDTFEVVTKTWIDETFGWAMVTTDAYYGDTGHQEFQSKFRRPTDEEVSDELNRLRAQIAFIERHWRPDAPAVVQVND